MQHALATKILKTAKKITLKIFLKLLLLELITTTYGTNVKFYKINGRNRLFHTLKLFDKNRVRQN